MPRLSFRYKNPSITSVHSSVSLYIFMTCCLLSFHLHDGVFFIIDLTQLVWQRDVTSASALYGRLCMFFSCFVILDKYNMAVWLDNCCLSISVCYISITRWHLAENNCILLTWICVSLRYKIFQYRNRPTTDADWYFNFLMPFNMFLYINIILIRIVHIIL